MNEEIFMWYYLYITVYTLFAMIFIAIPTKSKEIRRIIIITNLLSITFWGFIFLYSVSKSNNELRNFWNMH